jgi:DNA gyrase subunit B
VRLAALEREDLDWFAGREDLELAPGSSGKPGIARFVNVMPALLRLLGIHAAGEATPYDGIRLVIPGATGGALAALAAELAAVFGLPAAACEVSVATGQILLGHRVATCAWNQIAGTGGGSGAVAAGAVAAGANGTVIASRSIPSLVWSVGEELRSAFLRGCWLVGAGVGHGAGVDAGQGVGAGDDVGASRAGSRGLVWHARTRELASALQYLLASYGAVGVARELATQIDADGREGRAGWTLTIDAPAELARLGAVWHDLPGAEALARVGHEGPAFAVPRFEQLDGDLMALEVTSIAEVAATNGNVYDFSVETDENFVCGFGGIAACNTDADVDGSHIRTLLLTFFFRHFNELFEKGHVYIAQPPLYKVKKGKTELYLKNEGALEDYLLDSVCRETVLSRGPGADAGPGGDGDGAAGPPVTGNELAALVKQIGQARRLRTQLDKRSDGRITAQFAEAELSEDDLKDRGKLERLEAKVMAEVARRHGELGQASATYQQDLEHGTWELKFPPGVHGIRRATVINSDVVRSAEFVELRRISAELRAMLAAPLALTFNTSEPQPIASWDEIATVVEELGRKGLQIQRYKGLGEMNAEQLWETTMDPTKRNLLKVKIEEMEAADGIFTKLMGDLVEPRREFIEQNALNVRNLDV